jgi:hypothetical protein
MKINIVNYELDNPWILSKIANNLAKNLIKLGHETIISKSPIENADIFHHITHHSYKFSGNNIDTVMITHVDNYSKLSKIKKDIETAKVGICMSKATMAELISLGLSQDRLCFAHMAHDGLAKPRKIAIGLTTRLYPDGRKNEKDFFNVCNYINPTDFRFEIMGFGWHDWIDKMRKKGFEVNYFESFDYDTYMSLMSRLDYYLYLGNDEGSAAFIDALAAGVKTIVQPQGFHLDARLGITHSFTDFEGLKSIFEKIGQERQILVNSVSSWTWENYAKKHILIWEKCLKGEPLEKDIQADVLSQTNSNTTLKKLKLIKNYFTHKFKLVYNMRNVSKFPGHGGAFYKNNNDTKSKNNI